MSLQSYEGSVELQAIIDKRSGRAYIAMSALGQKQTFPARVRKVMLG